MLLLKNISPPHFIPYLSSIFFKKIYYQTFLKKHFISFLFTQFLKSTTSFKKYSAIKLETLYSRTNYLQHHYGHLASPHLKYADTISMCAKNHF